MEDRYKILAVDDDPANLFIVSEMLGDEYDIKTATSGEEAFLVLDKFTPHIILLDIMMPGMDGYEVCQKIKSDYRFSKIKILFVSAKDMVEERLAGYQAGGDDYITKPFDQDELLAKIKVYLRFRYKSEDSLEEEIVKQEQQPQVFQKINQYFSSILYIQSIFPYCKVVCKSNETDTLLLRTTLKNLEANFHEKDLLRVHRSYLINPLKAISFQKKGTQDYTIVLKDNDAQTIQIPVGRKYHTTLKRLNPKWFISN